MLKGSIILTKRSEDKWDNIILWRAHLHHVYQILHNFCSLFDFPLCLLIPCYLFVPHARDNNDNKTNTSAIVLKSSSFYLSFWKINGFNIKMEEYICSISSWFCIVFSYTYFHIKYKWCDAVLFTHNMRFWWISSVLSTPNTTRFHYFLISLQLGRIWIDMTF